MSVADGTEPIADDEIVYRRILDNPQYYTSDDPPRVHWLVFRPIEKDVNGLSVWRAKYKTAREAAIENARPGKRYYVAGLLVSNLRAAPFHVHVEPSVEEGGIGHASLTNLNSAAYRTHKDRLRELAEQIARELCGAIHGPFEIPNNA